jgi:hypothetical protein
LQCCKSLCQVYLGSLISSLVHDYVEESCEGLQVLKVIAKYFGCACSAYVLSLSFLLYHFCPYKVIDVVRMFAFLLLETQLCFVGC